MGPCTRGAPRRAQPSARSTVDPEHPAPRQPEARARAPRDRGLALEGVRAEAISSEQAPGERAGAVARFREGRVHVLVATDLLARGIDFLNVRTVVNYDFPLSPVDYVHRCVLGRC